MLSSPGLSENFLLVKSRLSVLGLGLQNLLCALSGCGTSVLLAELLTDFGSRDAAGITWEGGLLPSWACGQRSQKKHGGTVTEAVVGLFGNRRCCSRREEEFFLPQKLGVPL